MGLPGFAEGVEATDVVAAEAEGSVALGSTRATAVSAPATTAVASGTTAEVASDESTAVSPAAPDAKASVSAPAPPGFIAARLAVSWVLVARSKLLFHDQVTSMWPGSMGCRISSKNRGDKSDSLKAAQKQVVIDQSY